MSKSYTIIYSVSDRIVSMSTYANTTTKEYLESQATGFRRTFGWDAEIVETTPEIRERAKQFKIDDEKRIRTNINNSKRFGVCAKPIPWTLTEAKRYIKS